jgi:Holliday junction resolvase-like predicted endonuclease
VGTSVPLEPRWSDATSPAEKALWRWAVDQLDDRVLVLPQVAITLREKGRPDEAEIDLLLIDPDGGVVIVEVKGGRIRYDAKQAAWRNADAAGATVIRDPVEQAKRARSLVKRLLDKHGVDASSLPLRWAFAAPDCRIDTPGGGVIDQHQLWDDRAATQLARMHAMTVGQLSAGERPSDTRTDHIVNVLRGRSVEGRASLAAALTAHADEVEALTESHRNVRNRLTADRRVLVHGGAGTGKTGLALGIAADHAMLGSRVLLTSWNIALADHLRDALRELLTRAQSPLADQVGTDPTGRIVVQDLGTLVRDNARGADDRPLTPPTDRRAMSDWFYRELPEHLTPALTGGEFDVVVIDEAQDLREDWALAVTGLATRDGRVYAFQDDQQDLFRADAALPDLLDVHHELKENFRNTPQIAAFAARFGDVELDCIAPDGPPVRFVECAAEDVIAQTRAVADLLQREESVRDEQLAVLWLYHNPYQNRTSEVVDAYRTGKRVETNAATFKGLERPVVVLGLDTRADEDPEALRRNLYTAATRASALLVVVAAKRESNE